MKKNYPLSAIDIENWLLKFNIKDDDIIYHGLSHAFMDNPDEFLKGNHHSRYYMLKHQQLLGYTVPRQTVRQLKRTLAKLKENHRTSGDGIHLVSYRYREQDNPELIIQPITYDTLDKWLQKPVNEELGYKDVYLEFAEFIVGPTVKLTVEVDMDLIKAMDKVHPSMTLEYINACLKVRNEPNEDKKDIAKQIKKGGALSYNLSNVLDNK